MRFDNFHVAQQVILTFGKTNLVHASTEAIQFNRHFRGARINGLALLVKEHAELRRHATLEDGYFSGKIAVAQEASAVQAFGNLGFGGFVTAVSVVVVTVFVMGMGLASF